MNQCLVTKLKGSVDDSNLLKLGEMKCNVSLSGENRAVIRSNDTCICKIIGAGEITYEEINVGVQTGTQFDVQTLSYALLPPGNYTLSFSNKYSLKVIESCYFDINLADLKYSDNLTLI